MIPVTAENDVTRNKDLGPNKTKDSGHKVKAKPTSIKVKAKTKQLIEQGLTSHQTH